MPVIRMHSRPKEANGLLKMFMLGDSDSCLGFARTGSQLTCDQQPDAAHCTENASLAFSLLLTVNVLPSPGCQIWQAFEHPVGLVPFLLN